MFGLFKRTKIELWETELLRNTLMALPKEYSALIDQINDGLFRGVLVNVSDIPGFVAFTFNSGVLKKYENENENDYKLTNIKVFDDKTLSFVPYEIYVSAGMISGYSLGEGEKHKIVTNKIDIADFKKEILGESDFERIINILTEQEKARMNPSEVYVVFIGGKEFFHIKDLEDGDFIGIDIEKRVYKITHDPMEVIPLDENIVDILSRDVNI
ncbi:hypothetical protein [Chitinophaga flava]|uniref:Uncharacterized protein n=1 Tax=Chitinophaga flava TaxID=2259036 RepID=A0A365XRI2_9BACT|nr:hypothetical protein [Chitinophaga flava]RBL88334.1 hypothetical protein DF182_17215 [Chitinophaga flava]